MTSRLNLVLSDDLSKKIDEIADESNTNKSEILRKALTMYIAAKDAPKQGRKVGLVNKDTEKLEVEFIGL
ncbi:MAG: transcriptional regulator [Stenotrophomonas acidaminiphila]|nr:MAG: transcriptional regulator [Stenotrophomonas acidaminiphila]